MAKFPTGAYNSGRKKELVPVTGHRQWIILRLQCRCCRCAAFLVSVHFDVKTPLMGKDGSEAAPIQATEPNRTQQPATSSRADIDTFLGHAKALHPAVKAGERGRLIFALDATMSRQPTWDQACQLQAEMFREAATVGGLDLQLVYYRGLSECRASGWVAEPERFGKLMSRIDCRGGQTQIAKVLAHARRENDRFKVGALVFIGDAMEEKISTSSARAPANSACAAFRH